MRIWKLACVAACCLALLLSGCGFSGTEKETSTDAPQEEKTAQVEMAVPKEGIPVLMYHMIGDVPDNDAVLLESHFREQMKFLKDNDFHPISLDELYAYMAEGKPVPVRPVVLTFDDGYPDTYSIVMPVLKEYGFKGPSLFRPMMPTKGRGSRGSRLKKSKLPVSILLPIVIITNGSTKWLVKLLLVKSPKARKNYRSN